MSESKTHKVLQADPEVEARVGELLGKLTLGEKIGQMSQWSAGWQPGVLDEQARGAAESGMAGSFLNASGELRNELQRKALQTRLGIPLIFGRDVIHGYRTIFPIPLGQAASFNPELAEQGSEVAAREAASQGIDWTFAPMVDIARDPRWGRVAEGGGEDPVLASSMGAAWVRGFQGEDLRAPERLAACAKHYVGYGAAEAGKDYNTTEISERTLREVYLPSFKACVKAGAATLMSAFNDLNGVPASANEFTLRQVLRREWEFRGYVVSDWASLQELLAHGLCEDERAAALQGVRAGVDMEMVSRCYATHLPALVEGGKVPMTLVDDAVRAILRIKVLRGLFENPIRGSDSSDTLLTEAHLEAARRAARQSVVLLKNTDGLLPLSKDIRRLAVIGPMAENPAEVLGCWSLDGRAEDTKTPLFALREQLSAAGGEVFFAPGLSAPSSTDAGGFAEAVRAAERAQIAIVFVGEEATLSGEAHSRAFLNLPGAQDALIRAVAATGRPLVVVVLAGRPLTIADALGHSQALLYGWHPGTQGGPALADLLFGVESPSAKLPVTIPRAVGQVPIYYAHKNTGRPPAPGIKGVPTGTALDPQDFTARHMDVESAPLFPFGFGLSYTTFEYENLRLGTSKFRMGETLEVSVDLKNRGARSGCEIVQLYIRDLYASVTRPVKELKKFQRVSLDPGQTRAVRFQLHSDDLAFWGRDLRFAPEPGRFHLWVGPSSAEGIQAEFELV